MTDDQKLLKETFDLLKEVLDEFVSNKLPLLRKYVDLEGKVNKNLSDAIVGKPSLFDKTPATEPMVTQAKPVESLFDPPTKKADPLRQGNAGNFDHLPDLPPDKKEPIVVPQKMRLPWEQDANEPESHPLGTAEKIHTLPKKEQEDPF